MTLMSWGNTALGYTSMYFFLATCCCSGAIFVDFGLMLEIWLCLEVLFDVFEVGRIGEGSRVLRQSRGVGDHLTFCCLDSQAHIPFVSWED